MKKSLIVSLAIILLAVAGGIYLFNQKGDSGLANDNNSQNGSTTEEVTDNESQEEGGQVVIGKSVEGEDIVAYNYGTGDTRLLFVGGVHGGYSWNTALLAYQTMDYLETNPEIIPSDITVTIIPVLNPDGLEEAVGTTGEFSVGDVSNSSTVLIASRTNSNNVDLSRNFDCNWKSSAVWQTNTVSGGSEPFSEPESQAIKNYIESHNVSSAVVWYSAAGGVYASKCGGSIMPETTALNGVYGRAAGYPVNDSYDYYATTGDLVNWLAKENIPAISVLLTNHTDTELSKNLNGLRAVLDLYSKI